MLGGLCPVCEWAFVAAIAATQQATSMTLTPVPSRQSSRSGEELYKEAKGAFQLQITPSPFFIILSHQTIEHRLKTPSRRLHCFQVAVWKEIPALHGCVPWFILAQDRTRSGIRICFYYISSSISLVRKSGSLWGGVGQKHGDLWSLGEHSWF